METDVLAISVLLTREEYMALAVQLYRRKREKGLSVFAVLGGVLAILGMAGLFFGQWISLSPYTAGILLLFGAFLLCYDGAVAPVLVRGAAAREYEEKDDLRMTNQYRLSPESVQVSNSRIEGTFPLRLMSSWISTADGFCLSFGRECHVWIPHRLLTGEQSGLLRRWLEEAGKPSAGESK